jgi:hypothetical protein
MTNKEQYIALCEKEPSITIFGQPWWLDVVSYKWDVSIVLDSHGNVIGAMPYTLKKRKFNITTIEMPYLTGYLPIWIKQTETHKLTTLYSDEQKILMELIAQIPKVFSFNQYYEYNLKNALPFQWSGYEDTTMYSFCLELTETQSLFKDFKENVRRNIRKAEKLVTVEITDDVSLFYDISKNTFDRQEKRVSYKNEFLKELDDVLKAKKQRRIYIAKGVTTEKETTIKDILSQYHAAIYVVWDSKTMYFSSGGAVEDLRSSGAMSLLFWHAIQDALKMKLKQFDFCNASLPQIERFKRSFGGVRIPYFKMSKFKSPFIGGIYKILKNR